MVATHKPKILMVDDRPENLIALEKILGKFEIELFKAYSGNEALAMTLHHKFALVLLDVQMPEMDGFETAQLMRQEETTKSLPIIFVTAISKEEKNIFQGYETGVDYLFKPIEPAILKAKVSVFIELYRNKQSLEEALFELEQKNKLLSLAVIAPNNPFYSRIN